ncbi:MAG: SAM-dependent methyltransferase [Clostridiales bacterium]|jgi:tRNA G37 N-methylase Trm5|nr:SAM-dependent methyltransferase [Clostridiales bacterium]
MSYKNPLSISHEIVSKYLGEGDTAVDATAGNGNDTVFLAKIVGCRGKVYSFDIQNTAIENTRKKLKINDLLNRVELINEGHQLMDKYVPPGVKVIMFNLGYLPGGNHQIATKPKSTISAINKSLDLLQVGGIIMMVIYYGGDSGFEEKDAVMKYIEQLNYKKYSVLALNFVNWLNCPPISVCIEKTSE